MARIRIVDEWVRAPGGKCRRDPVVMVVAERWAEQRVLMRAFVNSMDRQNPSIQLGGKEFAISPTADSTDAWGIHVRLKQEGAAQELRKLLEAAATFLSGGNVDNGCSRGGSPLEASTTNYVMGGPGATRNRFSGRFPKETSRQRHCRSVETVKNRDVIALLGRTLPLGFELGADERLVLGRLSVAGKVTKEEVQAILPGRNVHQWMRAFMERFSEQGVDLIYEAAGSKNEILYILRR